MTNDDYPENMTCHVRDPKFGWKIINFIGCQGARDKDDIGQVLLFESDDMINWNVINIIKVKVSLVICGNVQIYLM